MKVSTITCHDVYNYGASLQAYALQEYCKSLGCDYEIIDYKPPYLSQHFKLGVVANSRYDVPVVKQLYLLMKLPGRLSALPKKRHFDAFTSQFLHLSSRRYHSCEDLRENCPDADLYLAGSDQIWNTLFKNGHDASFYLDFVDANKRRVAYAASFATDKIFNDTGNLVSQRLQNFDAVSVREMSALTLLESLGRRDGVLVVDPVFLLGADKWLSLVSNAQLRDLTSDYILVYDCERSLRLKEIAVELKKRTGLPVYSLATTCGGYVDRDYSLSGPLEFLSLLSRARYVVANSFHALAFSLIFKKDFYIVNRSEAINTRMRDFLSYLHMSQRLIDTPSQLSSENIDHTSSSTLLNTLIAESKRFLQMQISSCRG